MSSQFSLGLSGHGRLEKELGDGIPKGAIALIEGDYGAGKSVLLQQFSHGLRDEGTVVTLVSTGLGVRGFLDQMYSLSHDIVRRLLDGQILLLQAEIDSSGALSSADNQEEYRQLLQRLMNAEALWDADVIIIDTFDAILHNDPQFKALIRQNDERQAALEVISFSHGLTTKGKTIIVTVGPSSVDESSIGPFRSIADIHLELEMVEVGNDVRRNIFVKRFAGMGQQVGDHTDFSVRSGIGLIIESRSVT